MKHRVIGMMNADSSMKSLSKTKKNIHKEVCDRLMTRVTSSVILIFLIINQLTIVPQISTEGFGHPPTISGETSLKPL